MNKRWAPAVIIAVVAAGGGLTACGGSGSSPQAAGGTATDSGSPAATMSSGTAQNTATSGTASSAPAPGNPVAGESSAAPKPVPPPPDTTASGSGSFTVPVISGNNVVSAHGTYTKLGTERVKVTICATKTGTAYAVGALAVAYNSSGASKNVGAVILPEAGSSQACGTKVFLFYTAHLKVHAFIGGNNGTITQTGPVKNVY